MTPSRNIQYFNAHWFCWSFLSFFVCFFFLHHLALHLSFHFIPLITPHLLSILALHLNRFNIFIKIYFKSFFPHRPTWFLNAYVYVCHYLFGIMNERRDGGGREEWKRNVEEGGRRKRKGGREKERQRKGEFIVVASLLTLNKFEQWTLQRHM